MPAVLIDDLVIEVAGLGCDSMPGGVEPVAR
jgi:hypothetical protein